MVAQRAAAEPDVRTFDAEVRSVDGAEVTLDRTYFYAESGGQPADRGTVSGIPVDGVRTAGDGTVVHVLAEQPAFGAGDEVTCVVDDAFRTYCMRAHTASHVLYGAGRRLLDDLGYGGFDIGPEKVRVDFRTTTDVDDGVLVELERLTNRAVWDSRAVSWEEVPAEEAREREEVAFNTKTEEGVFADSDRVRVVTVGGADGDAEPWDVAACGGTHVSNTEEIGPVEVLDRSNPGEGLTRIEFAVGPAAIDRRAEVRTAAFETARTLGTGVDDMAELAATLRDEKAELESELRELKAEVLDARLAAFRTAERDGATWRVGSVDGFGPNEVGERLKERAGDLGDVLVAVGEQGSTFVAVASTGEVAAGDVVGRVTDEFGGGGGGGPTFAQGGGLSADPAEVVEFLRG
ncbi:alanine--tRNA ligase-related protein [Halegenticoccus soli]|uniref:alanine--tRNA ligase-related protein n=1 Tax=Halegenticoccus soli TaxID=1985678 RepID=UPI000C6DA9F9|nr:DHHA1 domain-containing protein [Halegenticoccus soli]